MERQRQVCERAIAREAQREERQRLELEKRATRGRRGHCATCNVPIEAATPPQLSPLNMASIHLWPPSTLVNPISAPLNPNYFYNPLFLPHFFPAGLSTLNVNEESDRIPWTGNGHVGAGCQRTGSYDAMKLFMNRTKRERGGGGTCHVQVCHGRDIETKTNDEQQRKLCIAMAEPWGTSHLN